MKDFATSSDTAVQAQLDRLAALSLPQGRFGLETIRALLARLGDPHKQLPPTFHVAGTNGKGSVCAYLRAMLEAQGLAVHATTSPHLVRYNERIRIAGKIIDDTLLAALLEEVLDKAQGLGVSFFETTIAASFLAFSRHPADACVIETGLGGRFDATSALEAPAACGIATIGIDHERFLLAPEDGTPEAPLARIAFEKAGIIKPGSPVATLAYPEPAAREIERAAEAKAAPLAMRGKHWHAEVGDTIAYRDAHGALDLPLPSLAGVHQADNAALAVAILRHQTAISVSPEAMARGLRAAAWSARLQLLGEGPLTALAPGHAVWLDGGHNPDAGAAIAQHFSNFSVRPEPVEPRTLQSFALRQAQDERQKLHLVIGMLVGKASNAITNPLEGLLASVQAVPVPNHDSHPASAFGPDAHEAQDVSQALCAIPDDGLPVLIAGSLYLAGEVLRLNGEVPN